MLVAFVADLRCDGIGMPRLKAVAFLICQYQHAYRGILVYNISLISITNSISDGATNKSALNTKRS